MALCSTNAIYPVKLIRLQLWGGGWVGVEMEALTTALVAALTIYDMCKAVQKDLFIGLVRLLAKSGGKSGDFKVNV